MHDEPAAALQSLGVLPLPMLPERPAQWPPLRGRRKFRELSGQPTLISDAQERPGRKLFRPMMSDDHESLRSPAERRQLHLLLCTTPTGSGTLKPEDELVFLSSKRNKWKPVGGGATSAIPVLLEDQFLTPGVHPNDPTSTPRKVAEPSPSLLRPKKYEEPKPIRRIHDGKKVDATKVADRLYADVERRERKLKEAQSAAQRTHDAAGNSGRKRLTSDELDDYCNRLVTEPLSARSAEERRLTERFAPAPPARKMTKEQQEQANRRLFVEGQNRIRAATARAVRQYVEDVAPKFAQLTPAQIHESAGRLSTPRAAGTL